MNTNVTVTAFVIICLAVLVTGTAHAVTSTGKTPINDLGTGYYQGYQGGLYPNGLNVPPQKHFAGGLHQAVQVRKLDSNGMPSASGKIVLISVGMSNTTMEFSTFKPLADADSQKNPDLVIVDCAQSGKDAKYWTSLTDPVWTTADQRLASAGVSPKQVQAVWLKQAIAQENKTFPADAQELQGYLATIARNIKSHYPNTRLLYVSNRIYAGYATTTLNPEPYAYQSGFSVKWLIESQINATENLNYDPSLGTVVSPWIAWGPYMWADGIIPRSDGLIWLSTDFGSDGTHPNAAGSRKVANMLLSFFKNDKTSRIWFTKSAYQSISVSGAKVSAEGTAVTLSGVAVTMGTGTVPGRIYVEDSKRTCGIMVSTNSDWVKNSWVNMTGTVATSSDGERYIDATDVSSSTGTLPPKPIAMNCRSLGGSGLGWMNSTLPTGQQGVVGGQGANNIGLLVRTCGSITQIDPSGNYYYIDDGSNLQDGTTTGAEANVGVRVSEDGRGFTKGQMRLITGISSCFRAQNGTLRRLLRPVD